MEPMTLGSPVGSPSNPTPTSPYLPGFLMGDPMPQPTSPSKTPRQVHFAPNMSGAISSSGPSMTLGPTSLNDSLSRFHKNQREKSGGPPTVGLFDTLDVNTSVLSSPLPSTPFQSPTPLGQAQTPTGYATPTQTLQHVEDNEKWVTVFGFPPSAASSILGQFSQVGHIVEHRFPGQGNWVNICYSTKLDARRALSYNGKILGGHTMIGVVLCSDHINSSKLFTRTPNNYNSKISAKQPVIRMFPCRNYMQPGSALRDMTNVLSSFDTPGTPKSPQTFRLSQRMVNNPSASPYLTSPRGGRQLGISSPTENEVIGLQNTPTKNTSFMTKAVDFVFGW